MHLDSLLFYFFLFLKRLHPDTYEEISVRKKLPIVAVLSVVAVAAGMLAGVIPGILQKSELLEPLDVSKIKQMKDLPGGLYGWPE